VPDTSALEAAKVYLNYFGRYGAAHQMLSDKGSQFVNDIISEFTTLLGVEEIQSIAYSKEENSIVERANKEVVRHLRAILFDSNLVHIWSHCIPYVQRIMNATAHSSIGTTPASLLFGNAINLDRGILLPYIEDDIPLASKPLSSWSANQIQAQSRVLQTAQKYQRLKDDTHISQASPKRTEYAIDEYVLVEYPSSNLKRGPPNKLQTFLKGPLKVVSYKGNQYNLKNLVTSKIETVHLSRLHPFIFDEINVNPIDVANRDQFSTPVERVIAHHPLKVDLKSVKRSELSFTVRWLNLPEEFDRILPWKELRNNPALHQYLNENNMRSIIPTEFKANYQRK
jgi:hypothetical protein